ncbi:hypothetical protein J6590_082662 [Homalodisca vitripennis]|nr:hypothetical protein J6590_082662 [Homalodisca vitripennis]
MNYDKTMIVNPILYVPELHTHFRYKVRRASYSAESNVMPQFILIPSLSYTAHTTTTTTITLRSSSRGLNSRRHEVLISPSLLNLT